MTPDANRVEEPTGLQAAERGKEDYFRGVSRARNPYRCERQRVSGSALAFAAWAWDLEWRRCAELTGGNR